MVQAGVAVVPVAVADASTMWRGVDELQKTPKSGATSAN